MSQFTLFFVLNSEKYTIHVTHILLQKCVYSISDTIFIINIIW